MSAIIVRATIGDKYDGDMTERDLINVAEAKPGDRDFNGGRWHVFAINWIGTPVQFTSDSQVVQAALDGYLTISADPVASFVCPVIHVPRGGK